MIWKNEDLLEICLKYHSFRKNGYQILNLEQYIEPEYIEIDFAIKEQQPNLMIEISYDGKNWFLCDDMINDCSKIKLFFYRNLKIKFIKFINSSFQIIKIKCFVRRYPGVFMAKSYCGWGDRMMALLNAMYLAKQTNFKFGFTWEEMKIVSKENKKILYSHVPSEDKLFDKEYLEKYSYTNQYTSPDKEKFISGEWITNATVCKNNIRDFFEKPFEYYWGFVTNHCFLSHMVKNVDINYIRDFPKLWKEIGFSQEIKDIFIEVDKIYSKIQDGFIAIHVRSGEIVYPSEQGYLYNGTGHDYLWQKAMPVEILLELLQQYALKNKNIVLFGEDILTLKQVISYAKDLFFKNQNYLYLANDFINDEAYQKGYKKDIFDLYFMSKASEIIGGASGFCELASLIGQGKRAIVWIDLFDEQKRYDIFRKYYGIIKIHPLQNAFSLEYMYMGEFYLTKDIKKMKELILKALELDQIREFHHIALLYCCLTLDQIEEAENYLEQIIKNRKEKFIYVILRCILYTDLKNALFTNKTCINYPNLTYLIVQFMNHEKEFYSMKNSVSYYYNDSAVFRIKNSLSYRLGIEMIQAKNLLKMLKLPFILLKIILKFKKEQKMYKFISKQNPNLVLRPLEKYVDYNDALQVKKHLSFIMGNLLVTKPFSFPFRAYNIYKKWKKDRNNGNRI
ncbi:TPA: hypothetical protein SE795_001774 [Campylobacter jejuni]|nr:hypothetical protein [Campylobacter jejuni]